MVYIRFGAEAIEGSAASLCGTAHTSQLNSSPFYLDVSKL
jgi:hypothetical protein